MLKQQPMSINLNVKQLVGYQMPGNDPGNMYLNATAVVQIIRFLLLFDRIVFKQSFSTLML